MKKLTKFEAVPLAKVINNPAVTLIAKTAEKLTEKEAPYGVRDKYEGFEGALARDSKRARN